MSSSQNEIKTMVKDGKKPRKITNTEYLGLTKA